MARDLDADDFGVGLLHAAHLHRHHHAAAVPAAAGRCALLRRGAHADDGLVRRLLGRRRGARITSAASISPATTKASPLSRRSTVRWTFWPSLFATVAILALGWPLLRLFGPDFVGAYPAMFVLALGPLARASVGPAERLLTMAGSQRACALVYAAAFTVNLVGCAHPHPRDRHSRRRRGDGGGNGVRNRRRCSSSSGAASASTPSSSPAARAAADPAQRSCAVRLPSSAASRAISARLIAAWRVGDVICAPRRSVT